jgi:hypothetical protein
VLNNPHDEIIFFEYIIESFTLIPKYLLFFTIISSTLALVNAYPPFLLIFLTIDLVISEGPPFKIINNCILNTYGIVTTTLKIMIIHN